MTAVDGSLVGLSKAGRLAEENKVNIEFVHADLEAYSIGANK